LSGIKGGCKGCKLFSHPILEMSHFNDNVHKAVCHHPTDTIDCWKWQKEEFKKFVALKYKNNLNMKYELELLGEPLAALKNENAELKMKIKEKTAKENHNQYCFITINPKPEVKFETFRDTCIKFSQRKMFSKTWLVFEQRGATDDDIGKGFHAHVETVRNLDYKPSQIVRNTENTFKNLVDLKVKNHTLTIQHHGEDFHKDKMEYIEGVKTGEGKDEKQIMDVKFRIKNNLNVCYKHYAKENEFSETS